MILKCKQCEKEFELTESEIDFYRNKGLELPKRCKSCRDENKVRKRMSGSSYGGRAYGTGTRYGAGTKNDPGSAGTGEDGSMNKESKNAGTDTADSAGRNRDASFADSTAGSSLSGSSGSRFSGGRAGSGGFSDNTVGSGSDLSDRDQKNHNSFSAGAGSTGGSSSGDAAGNGSDGSAGGESKSGSTGNSGKSESRNNTSGSSPRTGETGRAASGSTVTNTGRGSGSTGGQSSMAGQKKWTRALFGALLLLILFVAGKYLGGNTDQPADMTSNSITPSTGIPTPEGMLTPEATPESTPTPENTPIPEDTPTPENTPVPESTPVPENTPVPESTPIPESTPVPENTPVPESTPTPESTPVPENTPTPEITDTAQDTADGDQNEVEILYTFRRDSYLEQHFEKHGGEFDYSTAEEYLAGANRVIQSPDALHKLEAEDGDDIYYLEETNEFVVVSTDGYIRTYFRPDKGIDYYNRQ